MSPLMPCDENKGLAVTEKKGQHLAGPMRQARVARSCKAARVRIPRVEIALDERCVNGLSFVEDFTVIAMSHGLCFGTQGCVSRSLILLLRSDERQKVKDLSNGYRVTHHSGIGILGCGR
jgi:hypothetical protein